MTKKNEEIKIKGKKKTEEEKSNKIQSASKASEKIQSKLETETEPSHTKLQEHKQKDQKLNSNQVWLIQPQPNWYDWSNLPKLINNPEKKSNSISEESINALRKRGELVLQLISDQFAISIQPSSKLKQQNKNSNHQSNLNLSTYSGLSESDKSFIHRILTDGTSSDKLSALTLLVSSAPLHSRVHLSNLLNLAKKNNREQAGRTTRALVEWLRGAGNPDLGGLPSNRKLKFFRDQPDLPIIARHLFGSTQSKPKFKLESHHRMEFDEWLAVWAFEDWFKNWYLDLLRVIESMSHDSLVFTRSQSISHIFNLLIGKPEQEQNLLVLLANKLGDGEKMICSRTSHYLLQLLQVHPLMKLIAVREISSLVLKPITIQLTNNISTAKPSDSKNKSSDHHHLLIRHHDHARYYGSITLNQIPLAKDDLYVANKLIQVYFELFNDLLGKATIKEEQEQQKDDELKEKNEDELEAENLDLSSTNKSHKKQLNNKNKKKSTLSEPKKLTKKQFLRLKEEEEALAERNSRLVAAILTGLNRALPYGNIESSTLEGYFETLFKISHTGLFNVSIQSLILIQNLLKKSKPEMSDRFFKTLYSTLIDHRLLSSTSKHTLYLNLLFKSLNSDQHLSRVFAFVKRIVQILPYHQPPFICSTLVLLGHLFVTKPACRELISKTSSTCSKDELKERVEGEEIDDQNKEEYDGKKRDPRYAHAENSSLWELVPLLQHYHPSVALNAIQLMKGEEITSTIDLEHHTVSNFLDKFVYRQPKKKQSQKGSAIMQPKLHLRVADVNKFPNFEKQDSSRGPLNSKSFLDLDELQVPADEVFFHKFFKKKEQNEEKNQQNKEKKSKRSGIAEDNDFGGRGGSDDGSEESEDEEEVWEAMKRTMDTGMKDEIMDDLADEDEWSEFDPAHDQTDSDDEQLAKLLKEDDSSDDDGGDDDDGGGDDDDDQVEFSNEEIDADLPQEGLSSDEDDSDKEHLPSKFANKRKKSSTHSNNKKRRKFVKDLPTFASADQYSHLLSDS